jgi:hypothetical protein
MCVFRCSALLLLLRTLPLVARAETVRSDGDGHTQHFITGSGGYVQGFVFGYAGLRVDRLGVFTFASQAPVLPPYGVTSMKLRSLHLLGAAFDFTYDAANVCAQAYATDRSTRLELRVIASGQRIPLNAGGAQVCVPLQPVAVGAVGYE